MQQQYHKMMESSPFRRPQNYKKSLNSNISAHPPLFLSHSGSIRPATLHDNVKKTLKYRPKAETDYQIRNNGGTRATACVFH